MATTESIRLIRLPDVMAATGLSRSAIYKFMNDGTFPKAIPLGARAIGWQYSAVQEWIENRISAAHQLHGA